MSQAPETDLDLDKLFLPAWAQESPSVNRYAGFSGDSSPRRDDRRGDRRPPRRDSGAPGGGRGFDRPQQGGQGPRGQRPGQRDDRRGPRPQGRDGDRRRDPVRQEPRREPVPLPDVNVTVAPEDKGSESLAKQIRSSGRAYPLFDIARIILAKPERQTLTFSVKKNAEGKPVQPLFVCALDDTLWLSAEEAVNFVLSRHFATFYQADRIQIEPPKGTYTFVAQCGISGVILGPPNHHDYQNQLARLHRERFSRMPFDMFKSRVRIVRDEEVVKKWVEDQSWKTEFICLNMPEPLRLASRDDVTAHFRQTHMATIIREVESHPVSGAAVRSMPCEPLRRLARLAVEDQQHFPLQIATTLSQIFASHHLQFFKVNRSITHVCIARPRFLDLEADPVSDGIRKIVEFINSHPRCNRRVLIESLAPTPKPEATEARPAAPVETPAGDASAQPAAEAPAPAAPTPKPTTSEEPTPDQTAIIADLHWLIHEGHVIEFANGALETAKKPLPKPPKPAKPAKADTAPTEAAPAATGADTAPPAVEEAPAGEPASQSPVSASFEAEAEAGTSQLDPAAGAESAPDPEPGPAASEPPSA